MLSRCVCDRFSRPKRSLRSRRVFCSSVHRACAPLRLSFPLQPSLKSTFKPQLLPKAWTHGTPPSPSSPSPPSPGHGAAASGGPRRSPPPSRRAACRSPGSRTAPSPARPARPPPACVRRSAAVAGGGDVSGAGPSGGSGGGEGGAGRGGAGRDARCGGGRGGVVEPGGTVLTHREPAGASGSGRAGRGRGPAAAAPGRPRARPPAARAAGMLPLAPLTRSLWRCCGLPLPGHSGTGCRFKHVNDWKSFVFCLDLQRARTVCQSGEEPVEHQVRGPPEALWRWRPPPPPPPRRLGLLLQVQARDGSLW